MVKLVAADTYTNSELWALYREALAFVSQNKSYTIRGKTYTRADEDFLARMEDKFRRLAAAELRGSTVAVGRHVRSWGRSVADIEHR